MARHETGLKLLYSLLLISKNSLKAARQTINGRGHMYQNREKHYFDLLSWWKQQAFGFFLKMYLFNDKHKNTWYLTQVTNFKQKLMLNN